MARIPSRQIDKFKGDPLFGKNMILIFAPMAFD